MAMALGPFEMLKPAARGGMAEVWTGRHVETEAPVAIKVMTGDLASRASYIRYFNDEVRAVAGLSHPGVVMVLDHGRTDTSIERLTEGRINPGSPWLAMEWCSLGTLTSLNMPLQWQQIRLVLLSVLDAFAHAHARGVVHRDLKPANILRAGPSDLRPGLKLSDFGIAWIGRRQESEVTMGTPQYMAPEQIRGQWRDYGPWTDLYSLGCLAWWLTTGRTPFKARKSQNTRWDTSSGSPHYSTPQWRCPRASRTGVASSSRRTHATDSSTPPMQQQH